MEEFEGRCWLDWWANSSTLLGSAEVAVVIAATDGWAARGSLISEDDDERHGFMFLYELDPVFTLRFDCGDTMPVTVHDVEDGGRRFSLTEYRGPEHRPIDHRIDL